MYTWALNFFKIAAWEFRVALYIYIKYNIILSHTALSLLHRGCSVLGVQVDSSFEQSAEEVKVWNKTE